MISADLCAKLALLWFASLASVSNRLSVCSSVTLSTLCLSVLLKSPMSAPARKGCVVHAGYVVQELAHLMQIAVIQISYKGYDKCKRRHLKKFSPNG